MHLFLHGFLGQKEDWNLLFSCMKSKRHAAIDLPGHGTAAMSTDIVLAVHDQMPKADYLIGYSAGGRIALELKERFPNDYGRLVLISTYLGMMNEQEKRNRWVQDRQWIELLNTSSLEAFLEKWYAQELFQSLVKNPIFAELFARRKEQNPEMLAQFLHEYSVAKQQAGPLPANAILIYGEEDLKYATAYRKLAHLHPVYEIKNAGHAVHLENPVELAKVIEEMIHEHN